MTTRQSGDRDGDALHGVVLVSAQVPLGLERLTPPASSVARQASTCSPGSRLPVVGPGAPGDGDPAVAERRVGPHVPPSTLTSTV